MRLPTPFPSQCNQIPCQHFAKDVLFLHHLVSLLFVISSRDKWKVTPATLLLWLCCWRYCCMEQTPSVLQWASNVIGVYSKQCATPVPPTIVSSLPLSLRFAWEVDFRYETVWFFCVFFLVRVFALFRRYRVMSNQIQICQGRMFIHLCGVYMPKQHNPLVSPVSTPTESTCLQPRLISTCLHSAAQYGLGYGSA